MIRRLVEVHYFENRESANPGQRRFWLMELRTPELLIELASIHPNELRRFKRKRPLLELAQTGNESALADAILEEERTERAADREYWVPLRRTTASDPHRVLPRWELNFSIKTPRGRSLISAVGLDIRKQLIF